MIDVQIEKSDVNWELLETEIEAALGNVAYGFSFNGGEVMVHLDDQATAEQITRAREIVEQHDPSQLTQRQQEKLAQSIQLETLRNENAVPLDVADYTDESPNIRKLAQKIAWLEMEFKVSQEELQA